MKENLKLQIYRRNFTLSFDYEEDIDIDDKLQIHPHNVIAEICDIAVFSNQIGNMKAEIANIIKNLKLELDILKANLFEHHKSDLSNKEEKKKPTITEVEGLVIRNEEVVILQKNIYKEEKHLDYLDSIYWSCRTKSSMLEKLSMALKPEDFQNEVASQKLNYLEKQQNHDSKFR